MRFRLAIASSVLALSVGAAAHADVVLPVQNLTFSDYTGAAPKNQMTAVMPTYWSFLPLPGNGNLVFVDAPGTATSPTGGYPVYGPFSNPPPGGNFVQADGNPDFESIFYQPITGLMGGETYTLSFWQAAGQQTGYSLATTEQWIVFLGANDPIVTCNHMTNSCSYNANGDEIALSHIMDTPDMGVYPWEQQQLSFTLPGSGLLGTQNLYFLAWGNGGSTVNQPPTVFLAGVNTPAPEPATLGILGAGLATLGAARRRRRKRVS